MPDFAVLLRSRPLSLLIHGASITFALRADTWTLTLQCRNGQIRFAGRPTFTLSAPDEVWDDLLNATPPPGRQSAVHLLGAGEMRLDGDRTELLRHLHIVSAVVATLRDPQSRPFTPRRELAARGEYHRITSALGTADVHVERCGTGPPILALATAGSSITQWHGLLTESDLADRYEIIAVDLPWHGSSSPTFGIPIGGWELTPELYTQFILDVSRTLGLDAPILLGVSMAGAAVVQAVATAPDAFAGAVACQTGPRVTGRAVPELLAVDIDQSLFVPERTSGLMNPVSPSEFRKRVWWGYSSGGHRLYAADIDSYQQWDFDEVKASLTRESPHIAILSGSFDTTVTPADSRELSEMIPNSSFCEMAELGHFPHAENPALFTVYLDAALDRVQSN